jgi:hypothetical protein
MCEKACSHIYVPLNILAEFLANIHSSENGDASDDA